MLSEVVVEVVIAIIVSIIIVVIPHCRRNHLSHPSVSFFIHNASRIRSFHHHRKKSLFNVATLVVHFVLSHAWRPDTTFVPVSLGSKHIHTGGSSRHMLVVFKAPT